MTLSISQMPDYLTALALCPPARHRLGKVARNKPWRDLMHDALHGMVSEIVHNGRKAQSHRCNVITRRFNDAVVTRLGHRCQS
jgi:hypothetical protein